MLTNYKSFADLFDAEGEIKQFSQNEIIIHPDKNLNCVYYIKKGLVKAYNITRYGEENLLIIRKSHEIFPLIWAITGQERQIIYQAGSDCELITLDRAVFEQKVYNNNLLTRELLFIVVEMYRLHSERIINLEYRTVRERIISFLILMADRFGEKSTNGILINTPLKHADIASSINSTRETTSKELSYLTKHNLITSHKQIYKIPNISKLRKML